MPVTLTGTGATCHCGREAAFILVMGALTVWGDAVPERAVLKCLRDLQRACTFGMAMGRRMSVFDLCGRNVGVETLGPAAEFVEVR